MACSIGRRCLIMPQLVQVDAEYDSGTERRKLSRALTSNITLGDLSDKPFFVFSGGVALLFFRGVKWMDEFDSSFFLSSPLESKARGARKKETPAVVVPLRVHAIKKRFEIK